MSPPGGWTRTTNAASTPGTSPPQASYCGRREGDLQRAAELHRRVLFLLTLGAASDPPISAVKLAMKMLGVPISPAVRGPALRIPEEAHEKVESVLREAGLLTAREVG